jgi:phosphatidylglycerophosphate synthase
MLDDILRPIKEVVCGAIVTYIPSYMTPNVITLASGVVGVVCAIFSYYELYSIALILWILNRILDGIDGVVARHKGLQSDFGGLLDLYKFIHLNSQLDT